jgi:hypothetical protein
MYLLRYPGSFCFLADEIKRNVEIQAIPNWVTKSLFVADWMTLTRMNDRTLVNNELEKTRKKEKIKVL